MYLKGSKGRKIPKEPEENVSQRLKRKKNAERAGEKCIPNAQKGRKMQKKPEEDVSKRLKRKKNTERIQYAYIFANKSEL